MKIEDMNYTDIQARVIAILGDFLPEGREPLTDTELLSDVFDSLTMMEIVFTFEDSFTINVPDEKIADMKTVADIVAALSTLKTDETMDVAD